KFLMTRPLGAKPKPMAVAATAVHLILRDALRGNRGSSSLSSSRPPLRRPRNVPKHPSQRRRSLHRWRRLFWSVPLSGRSWPRRPRRRSRRRRTP
ncbi:hypothetical protein IL306_010506, partial [Fusarium sp. DS 682]